MRQHFSLTIFCLICGGLSFLQAIPNHRLSTSSHNGSIVRITGQPKEIFDDACSATSSIQITATGNSASISWEAVDGVTSFDVEVESEQNTPDFNVEQRVTGTTFEVSGLTAGGLYKVKVKSRCGDKPETVVFFTAGDGSTGNPTGQPTGNCAATSGVTVNSTGATAVINWEPVAGVATYEVEVESEQTTQTFHVEQQVSGTTFEVSGLTAGGLYKVKVKSRCGDKPETIVFFTAGDGSTGNPTGQPTGNCAATSGVTVNSTGTTASINWEPVVGVATYEVEVENEQTTPTFHVEQEVSGTNFEVSGLTAGGLYKVKVKSRCGDKPETIVFFTAGDGSTGNPTGQPTGNCAATSGVTVNSTGTTASINWEPVVGVATYEVEVESEQTTPTFHVEQEVSGTTFEVSGLTAGGLYKVKVKSRCGDKPETVLIFTADDGVTTGSGLDDATGSCAVVEHIRVEPLSGSSVLISWRPAADVNNYELEVELEESDFQQNLNILTSDTSWQIDDLAQGGLYKVQVHSKCTSGGETHSGEVFFIAGMSASVESQPIPDSCFSVSGLLVSPGDPVARITWDAVPGALYYEVEIEAEQTNIPWKLKLFALGSSTEVTGLVSGTAYQVKVKVICSGGTKSLPSIIRFTNGNGLGQAPSTLEVERRTREINNLSLSPNPARHLVHVQVDSPILQDARITLTDFTGRVYYQAIQQVPAGRFDWSVPLEQLGTGIYQVTLQVGNRISVGKLSIFQ